MKKIIITGNKISITITMKLYPAWKFEEKLRTILYKSVYHCNIDSILGLSVTVIFLTMRHSDTISCRFQQKLSRDAAETRDFANNGGDINPVWVEDKRFHEYVCRYVSACSALFSSILPRDNYFISSSNTRPLFSSRPKTQSQRVTSHLFPRQ